MEATAQNDVNCMSFASFNLSPLLGWLVASQRGYSDRQQRSPPPSSQWPEGPLEADDSLEQTNGRSTSTCPESMWSPSIRVLPKNHAAGPDRNRPPRRFLQRSIDLKMRTSTTNSENSPRELDALQGSNRFWSNVAQISFNKSLMSPAIQSVVRPR